MQFERLTIGLRSQYSKASESNPLEAKLDISFNDNRMTVKLSDDVCRRILAMAGEEIAKAAQVQIGEFVQQAIGITQAPMIEGKAQ